MRTKSQGESRPSLRGQRVRLDMDLVWLIGPEQGRNVATPYIIPKYVQATRTISL